MRKVVIGIVICENPDYWQLYQVISDEHGIKETFSTEGEGEVTRFLTQRSIIEDVEFHIVGFFYDIEANFGRIFPHIKQKSTASSTLSFHHITFGRVIFGPINLWGKFQCETVSACTHATPTLHGLVEKKAREPRAETLPFIQYDESIFSTLPDHRSFPACPGSDGFFNPNTYSPLHAFPPPEKIKEGSSPLSCVGMKVLGVFIAVLGITAVVLAFTVLNAATLGIAGLVVAGVGAVATLTGIGFFAVGAMRKSNEVAEQSRNYPGFD